MSSLNKRIPFQSEQHAILLQKLMARVDMSRQYMSGREQSLRDADDQYQAYIDTETSDELQGGLCSTTPEEDAASGEDKISTIFIPYSYSMLLSAHTYWTSVLFGRDPILQFQGRHGEAEQNVLAVETIINYQTSIGGMLPVLYVWLLDAGKYGFGVLCNYWEEEIIQVSKFVDQPVTDPLGVPIEGRTKRQRVTASIPGYVGNRIFNVNVYDYLPDPRVPLMQLQRGEFVGRQVELSWNDMVRGKADDRYFNVDVVKDMRLTGQFQTKQDTPYAPVTYASTDEDVGMLSGVELFVDLIPSDWGLGDSDYPEKWIFTVIEDMVIVECRPQDALHGKFPFAVIPYEVDGYQVLSRGMLELLKPLNDTLAWLVNSHLFNVRSALNNNFIVDPSRVHVPDLLRKGTTKIIRLNRMAWGSGVENSIKQLAVADVTQTHLQDAKLIGDMMQRIAAVTDNIMGVVGAGGRKTATEVRSSNTFGISRLKTEIEFWSELAFKPLAQMLLQNTQQNYNLQRMFRIAGDMIGNSPESMQVTPDDITGFYDFVPVDGTLPIDRYAQANLWRELLQGLMSVPQLAMGYNVGGIFEWVAQLAGLKNIKRFRIQTLPQGQPVPNNLIPLGGGQNVPRVPGTAGGAESRIGSVPEPGQIAGMGTTG